MHRDIKCGNIMIDTEGNTKIIDFGYASFIPEKGYLQSGRVGSLYWMAPEIYKKQFYNEKCDIWSFGIAILEMITGDPPYYGSSVSKEEVVNKLTHGIIPIPKDIPQNMNSFIRKCLKENPE
ncbi:protein kinase domain-containing protein, partial [Salmonella sp. s54836]|uniref:protein kinase domain-containing protein n=1 Tax=Salmonella sp. s54836 TaxID=3159673 RepID=UPI003980CD67